MGVEYFAQLAVAILQVASFISAVKTDLEGKKATQPEGFNGFIGSCIGTAIAFTIFYLAGAYDTLLGVE